MENDLKTPNIGELGVESVRLRGVRITELPMAERHHAIQQIKLVADNERQNKIKNILKGAPTQRVEYLQSRIREAEENIKRIRMVRDNEQQLVNEYTALVGICELRDKKLAEAKDDDERRAIKKDSHPYVVENLKQQLVQSKESIARFDDVTDQEHQSIANMRELLALCEKRDRDLRNLGVKIAPTN